MFGAPPISLFRPRALHRLLLSSGIVQAAGLGATLLLGIQLARFLGPAGYGTYGLLLAIVAIVCIPAQFGLPVFAIRDTARASADSSLDAIDLIRWFLIRSAAIAAAVSIALAAILLTVEPTWLHGRDGPILLAAGTTFCFATLAVTIAMLRGFGHNLLGQGIDALLKPTLVAGGVFVVYVGTGTLSVEQALAAQIGATMLCVALALGVLVKHAPKSPDRHRGYRPEKWIGSVGAFMANSLLGVINANYPIIVAAVFVSASDLGILRVALASAALLGLPSSIANIAAGPVIARHVAEDDTDALATTLSHTTLASVGFTAIGLMFFILLGREFLGFLFGEAYRGAYAPLLILGVGQLIIAAFGIAGTYLNLTGRERLVTRAFLMSVPFGIASSFLLAQYFGINGATAGTIVMAAAWHFYVFWQHRDQVRVPLSTMSAWRHLRAAHAGSSEDRRT